MKLAARDESSTVTTLRRLVHRLNRLPVATPAEGDYLAAMASDGDGPSSTAEVAARLKKKATSLGPSRANLTSKGLVYAPEYGLIAFTVPGMAAFIRGEGSLG